MAKMNLYNLHDYERVVERTFREVNPRIAPAVLEKAYPDVSTNGWVIRGRWGTVRFQFTLDGYFIEYGLMGLAEMMERQTIKAIDGALADLVRAEVARQVGDLERRMKKYADDGFAVVQAELDKRPVPVAKVRWYNQPIPVVWRRLRAWWNNWGDPGLG